MSEREPLNVAEPVRGPDQPNAARRERVWLAVGALVGVIVAGLAVGALLVLGDPGEPRPGVGSAAGSATTDPTAAVVAARDDSLRTAEEAAVVLSTLDYRTIEQGLTAWESITTAPLADELRAKRAQLTTEVQQAKTATTAKVLAAAVAKIIPDTGSADVIAVVEVTVTDAKGAPTVKHTRQKLTMSNTAEGWKVSAISAVQTPA